MDPISYSQNIFDLCFHKEPSPDNPFLQTMGIYRGLLRDNFKVAIKQAYPILTQWVTEDELNQLMNDFLNDGIHTRFYRLIAKQFKSFVIENPVRQRVPWLTDLVTYEEALYSLFYAEDILFDYSQPLPDTPIEQLKISSNPYLQLFYFSYPVQEFEKTHRDHVLAQDTYLILYRQVSDYRVKESLLTKDEFEFIKQLQTVDLMSALDWILNAYPETTVEKRLKQVKNWAEKGVLYFS